MKFIIRLWEVADKYAASLARSRAGQPGQGRTGHPARKTNTAVRSLPSGRPDRPRARSAKATQPRSVIDWRPDTRVHHEHTSVRGDCLITGPRWRTVDDPDIPHRGMSAHFRAWPRCINMQAERPVAVAIGACATATDGAKVSGSRAKYPPFRMWALSAGVAARTAPNMHYVVRKAVVTVDLWPDAGERA